MDVLVVDDNTLMQEVIRRFLGGLGYRVGVASRSDEALVLARHTPPALMLIDMHLPDGTGAELLHALRALPGCAATPAISMSGMDEQDARHMLTSDFREYVSKPIDLETLEALVRRYLDLPRDRAASTA